MNDHIASLYARLRAFSPGDSAQETALVQAMEQAIVHDDTTFDDAAQLSRTLEEFSLAVKSGPAAWEQFVAALAAPAEQLTVDVEVLSSFLSETADHLESMEQRILALETVADAKAVNDIFRSVHTIKGVSGFLNLGSVRQLSHELESLLDELRTQSRSVDQSLIDTLLLGCDALKGQIVPLAQSAANLEVTSGTATLSVSLPSVAGALEALRQQHPTPPSLQVGLEVADLLHNPELIAKFSQEALETLEVVERCILAMEKSGAAGDDLNEAFRAVHTLKGNSGFFGFEGLEQVCMEMESQLDSLRKQKRTIDRKSIESLLSALDRLRGLVQQSSQAATAPRPTEAVTKTEAEGFGKYTVKKKDIRVDTEKLDVLFDLIGELITAEAMVIDSPDLRGLELETFPRASAYLSKITRELQAVTMSIRMIPLEGLFSKMHRLVRDLGRKIGKDIELVISGAETEMDRNIIEEISDPLVHIIRNAIDHGIEDDARRRAKGKTPGGKIRLDARYEGNEIWITIADDGAGLDRTRILEVARSKGLVGSAELSDLEVWKLIFEPGFSTAKQVSEISGRGVGMDVVKKNLEKLRGQIDIHTVKDQGTDFILKIPLTLAIIDGVTLRSGTTLYSIPIADVVEFQNYQPERVTQTDVAHKVLRLRDEVMPVLPLSELFISTSEPSMGAHKQVSIVVKSQAQKLALVVDEIVGYKQIVLKALPESMAGLEGISGCTILGNGEVSLIIDVNALFRRYLA